MRALLSSILIIVTAYCTLAAENPDSAAVAGQRRNLIGRVIDYFSKANDVSNDTRFDFSVIGGPHYSSDAGFGIGLMGAGLYRTSVADTLTPQSQVSIYTDITTKAHFKVGVCGTHIFPGDRRRFTYDVSFSRIATQMWGIGYDECRHDYNESKYNYISQQISLNYRWRLGSHFFAGPLLALDYTKGNRFERPELIHGQATRSFNLGVGAQIEFDSRDNLSSAHRGTHISIEQQFNPRFMGNTYAFSGTRVLVSHYRGLWKDAVIALLLQGNFTYGNTPWCLMSTFGGSRDMRGYFEGRFRDKSAIVSCVEIRQHVWHRNGFVVWCGAGSVFSRFSQITHRSILPNYGLGYRWEFKHRVNVRADLGFGRGCTGFIFSINEAF
ncbi:MAG: BamA/TamA family outer membrane protein [Muribaculaceae bacterium]|nr:BamA/TamA family outer membrane protein [Muribaculaceae bacterium]